MSELVKREDINVDWICKQLIETDNEMQTDRELRTSYFVAFNQLVVDYSESL